VLHGQAAAPDQPQGEAPTIPGIPGQIVPAGPTEVKARLLREIDPAAAGLVTGGPTAGILQDSAHRCLEEIRA
jgi:hypothetical protein